jgi:hypothetical protein
MERYTNFREQGNIPVAGLVDDVHERRARHLSRIIGIAYHVALASVRANVPVMEVRHG